MQKQTTIKKSYAIITNKEDKRALINTIKGTILLSIGLHALIISNARAIKIQT